jgi:hypothetical protein
MSLPPGSRCPVRSSPYGQRVIVIGRRHARQTSGRNRPRSGTLIPALRAQARSSAVVGSGALKAATGLIIAHASWLARGFTTTSLASPTSAPASTTPASSWPASTGRPQSAHWTSVTCQARASGECPALRPASLTRHLSALARPSPASTTVRRPAGQGGPPRLRTAPVPSIAPARTAPPSPVVLIPGRPEENSRQLNTRRYQ